MNYLQNSVLYRFFAGSWFFGWLLATPEDRSHIIINSFIFRITNRLIAKVIELLQNTGRRIRKYENSSIVISNLQHIVGLLIFLFFIFDVILHTYFAPRIITEIILASTGLLIVLIKIKPGTWEGSLIIRIFKWWSRTD